MGTEVVSIAGDGRVGPALVESLATAGTVAASGSDSAPAEPSGDAPTKAPEIPSAMAAQLDADAALLAEAVGPAALEADLLARGAITRARPFDGLIMMKAAADFNWPRDDAGAPLGGYAPSVMELMAAQAQRDEDDRKTVARLRADLAAKIGKVTPVRRLADLGNVRYVRSADRFLCATLTWGEEMDAPPDAVIMTQAEALEWA